MSAALAPNDRRDEAIALCQRASRGALSGRMVRLDPEDPDTPLYLAINDLLDLLEVSMRESTAAMEASVAGRYHRHFLEQGIPGTFLQMANRTNQTMALMEERTQLSQELRSGVKTTALSLASAASELDATSTSLARASRACAQQIGTGERAAEAALDNIQAVAASTEALSASISEIARQSDAAALSTRRATEEAAVASEVMRQISQASEGVRAIVSVVNSVARQTNLLALNAAIEAARAGAAGRGFGVVASEVKALAAKTALATQDITERIQTMRNAADGGVRGISHIRAALAEAEDIASTISEAIAAQETETRKIAHGAAAATEAAHSVAADLSAIVEHAQGVIQDTEAIHLAAAQISHEAEQMSGELDGFLVELAEG